ncbi:MAG: DUF1996 domain-containing protein [Chloroflexota bacterium]
MHPRFISAVLSIAITLVPAVAAAQEGRPMTPPTAADERGFFRTVCVLSHEAADDPIVKPGLPGASHLHSFFGNVSTNAASTYESLRAADTSCRAAEDASGYWVPALYKDGVEVKPLSVTVYYRTGRHENDPIAAFPEGFRMIAGDATATQPASGSGARRTTFWDCRTPEPRAASPVPPQCGPTEELNLHIRFADCWDGVSLDSPNHKSHVAYSGRAGACPATHPTAIPAVAMIVHYPINGDPGNITLSSGNIYSAHADFFNAWDQAFLAARVDQCLNGDERCGTLGSRSLRGLLANRR